MDSKELERLLQKYWACETSLEEEQMLRDYFRTNSPTDATRDAAAMFAYFDVQRNRQLQDSSIEDKAVGVAKKKVRPFNRFINGSMRIAAGIAVLAVAVWFVRNEIRESTPQEMIDTYSDPELAFEETKRALMIISKGFSTAEQQARKLDLFNEAQQKVRNSVTDEKEANTEL
ncbi:MAG TPA: hypothetical protein VIL31_12815 [Cyclobacteriaceae bacterium]|jgi:hypothetical protein